MVYQYSQQFTSIIKKGVYKITTRDKYIGTFSTKKNLTLHNRLDPSIVIGFSARTQYEKWCLYCVVSYFCAGNIPEHGNLIVSNKYKK